MLRRKCYFFFLAGFFFATFFFFAFFAIFFSLVHEFRIRVVCRDYKKKYFPLQQLNAFSRNDFHFVFLSMKNETRRKMQGETTRRR